MLERFLKCKKAIIEASSTDDYFPNFSASDWTYIEATVSLLKSFYKYTLILQNRQTSLANVLPFYYILSTNTETSVMHSVKTTILHGISKRMSNYVKDPAFITACILDPRFKTRYFPTGITGYCKTDEVEAQAIFENEILDSLDSNNSFGFNATEGQSTNDSIGSNPEVDDDDFKLFRLQNPKAMSQTIPPISKKQEIDKEIFDYLQLENEPIDCSPYVWWNAHKVQFPQLSGLIHKYHSAPASSAESERTFSATGLTVNQLRQSLLPETIAKLTFLNRNILNLEL